MNHTDTGYYSKVESKALLNEAAKTREVLNYAWTALLVQASLLGKELTAHGMSERAKQIELEGKETLARYQMFSQEATAIRVDGDVVSLPPSLPASPNRTL